MALSGRSEASLRTDFLATFGDLILDRNEPLEETAGEEELADPEAQLRKMSESLLHTYVFSHLDEREFQFVLEFCKRHRLNPWYRDVWARIDMDADGQRVVQVCLGIQGLRAVTLRSGEFDGRSAYQWLNEAGEWVDQWPNVATPPRAARCSVWRKGIAREFTAIAEWDAYAQYEVGQQVAELCKGEFGVGVAGGVGGLFELLEHVEGGFEDVQRVSHGWTFWGFSGTPIAL